jgi:hypothetical protein
MVEAGILRWALDSPFNTLTNRFASSLGPRTTLLFLNCSRDSSMMINCVENGLHQSLVGIWVFVIGTSRVARLL